MVRENEENASSTGVLQEDVRQAKAASENEVRGHSQVSAIGVENKDTKQTFVQINLHISKRAVGEDRFKPRPPASRTSRNHRNMDPLYQFGFKAFNRQKPRGRAKYSSPNRPGKRRH